MKALVLKSDDGRYLLADLAADRKADIKKLQEALEDEEAASRHQRRGNLGHAVRARLRPSLRDPVRPPDLPRSVCPGERVRKLQHRHAYEERAHQERRPDEAARRRRRRICEGPLGPAPRPTSLVGLSARGVLCRGGTKAVQGQAGGLMSSPPQRHRRDLAGGRAILPDQEMHGGGPRRRPEDRRGVLPGPLRQRDILTAAGIRTRRLPGGGGRSQGSWLRRIFGTLRDDLLAGGLREPQEGGHRSRAHGRWSSGISAERQRGSPCRCASATRQP